MLYRVLTYGQKQAANPGPFGRILGLGVGYSKRIHGREIAGMFTAVKRIKAKAENRKKSRCPVTKESEHNTDGNVSTRNVQCRKTIGESQTDEKDWR
ncbi:hypothetical protein WN943_023079 [Citrus x changshan-huyou]